MLLPDTIVTFPPRSFLLSPAASSIFPPAPLAVALSTLPPRMITAPPRPVLESPPETSTNPPRPSFEMPGKTEILPDSPENVLPVPMCTLPEETMPGPVLTKISPVVILENN